MQSETLQQTDDYSASKATHPRGSLADMEGKIVAEYYFTGAEAVSKIGAPIHSRLTDLTICILVMRNGFVVVGKSAPASPENFNKAKGKRFAYEDAIKQLWPLEGYALRERLSQG